MAKVIISLTTFSFLFSDVSSELSQSSVNGFAGDFGASLRQFAQNLKHEEMQSLYKSTPADVEQFNANQKLAELTQDIVDRLSGKLDVLNEARDIIEAAILSSASGGGTYEDLRCCSFVEAGHEYSPEFGKPVDVGRTCFRLPSDVLVNSDGVQAIADISRPLEEFWAQKYRADPSLRWMYFGSETGYFRKYPTSFDAACGRYDPRFRPWYAVAVTPQPKNVILIIDISGSMQSSTFAITRMEIAKEAAKTVLSTLNPDDYVYVFGFSTNVYRVADPSCFLDNMVKATPENIQILKDWVDRLVEGGQTYYNRAFQTAFDVFDNHKEISSDPTVVMFLTDGDPTSGQEGEDILNDYKGQENLHVFTYAFGSLEEDGLGVTLLTSVANDFDGEFALIRDDENLRTTMGEYYKFPAFQRDDTTNVDIMFTVPYVDFSGLGLITTAAVPVYDRSDPLNPIVFGVMGMDTSLDELLADITTITSSTTYGFIVDTRGRTMVHPLMPKPSDWETVPLFYDISLLETATEVGSSQDQFEITINGDVRKEIIRQNPGIRTLVSRRAFSLGDPRYSGAVERTVTSTYLWEPIAGTSFTLALVVDTGYTQTETPLPNEGDLPSDDYYHLFDVVAPPGGLCDQFGAAASLKKSSFNVAPKGWIDPYAYIVKVEDKSFVDAINRNVRDGGNANFFDWKEGILEDVMMSSLIEEEWINEFDDLSQSIIWMYMGTRNGAFRMFPGHEMPKKYDPTLRPWYYRSIAYPGLIVMSTPYKAASIDGVVITLAVAIEDRSGQNIAGVMGMDFTVNKFMSIFNDVVGSECDGIDKICMLMDYSGFLVAHPDFLTDQKDGACNAFTNGNVFIGQCEPSLAKALIQNGNLFEESSCNNLEDRSSQKFYKVNPDASRTVVFSPDAPGCTRSTGNAFVSPVPEANLLLIAIDQSAYHCEGDCSCRDDGLCDEGNNGCHCVCQEPLDFDSCEESFENYPDDIVCPLAPVSLDGVESFVQGLEVCYDVNCEGRSEHECTGLGCVYCLLASGPSGDYEKLAEPYCTEGIDLTACVVRIASIAIRPQTLHFCSFLMFFYVLSV